MDYELLRLIVPRLNQSWSPYIEVLNLYIKSAVRMMVMYNVKKSHYIKVYFKGTVASGIAYETTNMNTFRRLMVD